jgi:hypothetical protein
MTIKKSDLRSFRNNEHLNFHQGVRKIITDITPVSLNVETQFGIYETQIEKEAEAIEPLRKSVITDELADADAIRDNTFRGITDAILSATRHFTPGIRTAAIKIDTEVLNHYGNITKRTYEEETTLITKFITDLQSKYDADCSLIGINPWLVELKKNNDYFNTLYFNRIDDESAKTQLRMKQSKIEVDVAFKVIIKRIEALIEINGEANYKDFVLKINELIDKYNIILAQRKGRNAKADEDTDQQV